MTRFISLTVLILATVAAAGATAATPKALACTGPDLAGSTFKAIPGSEGAGNIVYALLVKNTTATACTVSGMPKGVLLNKAGKAQATHIIPVGPNTIARVITLQPGKSTRATARFTPDVPGKGEGVANKQCEPTSYWFRVTAPGGGTTKVKLSPATPVCEHGQLQFSYYGH